MTLMSLLITLIVWGLILAIIWWALSQIPMPEPFNWVARAIFALIVVIVLLSLVGALPGVSLQPIRLS
jgi:heme A synthase